MAAHVRSLVVLAGGAGTRMGDRASGPKHLLVVGGRPLLLSAADLMCTELAVERVIFRVAYQAGAFVARWQAGEFPVPVRSSVLVGRLSDGPIGALCDTSAVLAGQRVLFSGGDVYYQISTVRDMLEFHNAHPAPLTVGVARSVPTRRPSTLVPAPDGGLAQWRRKPESSSADLINASLYLVDTDRIGWLLSDWQARPADAPEYKEDDLWRLIVGCPDRARLFALDGIVVNVNTLDQYAAAQRLSAERQPATDLTRS